MKWLLVRRLRSFVVLAAGASFVLNVALLMPAVYMMQVFDRVFTSNSVETLVMLGLITLLFLALGYFVDMVRARSLRSRSAARCNKQRRGLDAWTPTPCATSRSCELS